MEDRERRGRRAGRWRAAAAATLVALCVSAPAVAAEKKTVNEQILEIMRAKNVIDEQQYQDLLEQSRQEEAQRPVAAVSAAPSESPAARAPEWDVGWKNGFYVNKNDGSMKLKFGGLIQLDGAVINESRNLEQQIGGVGTGVEFRRARIFFEGGVYEHAIFKAEYDFAGGEAAFKDVWIGLQKIPWIERVRAGYMKEPFSLEQVTSDRFTTFMERALPDALVPARNTGLMIDRNLLGDRMYLGVGTFAKTDTFGDAFQNDANYNVTARLTGLPIYSEKGEQLLHLGLNYSHQFRGDGVLSYSQRPEAHLGPKIVSTGTINGVDGIDLAGAELAGVFGPVNFQSEIISSFVDRVRGLSSPTFWGAYGQLSWFLTGETRDYETRTASFGRTAPKRDFSIKNGTWGAFELAARYSYLTLDDKGVDGGIVSDITGGLNWYLYANLRLMLNYVYSNRHGLGDANIVESRVQIDF
jgi:phosphate-selective porin OprO/OprP